MAAPSGRGASASSLRSSRNRAFLAAASGPWQGKQRSGLQRIEWDGRDESGGLLPPGLYLLGLKIEGEVAALKQMVPVGVAY